MTSLDMSENYLSPFHSCVDLEEEFQLMRKMGLPTRLVNSYDDQEDEVHVYTLE